MLPNEEKEESISLDFDYMIIPDPWVGYLKVMLLVLLGITGEDK